MRQSLKTTLPIVLRMVGRISLSYLYGVLIVSMAMPQAFLGGSLRAQSPSVIEASDSPSQDKEPLTPQQQKLLDTAKTLDKVMSAARIGLREIPREQFDVEARQKQIGEDPEALYAWVRDQTRWIPYQGMLRGPQGVVMDQMGSHLDRALLLAELLEAAGHSVRLVSATLPEAEGEKLWKTLEIRERIESRITFHDELESAEAQGKVDEAALIMDLDPNDLRQRMFEARMDIQATAENLVREATEQTRALQDTLGWDPDVQNDKTNNIRPADEMEQTSVRDLWWVQLESDEGWLDLDPSHPNHQIGDTLVRSEQSIVVDREELQNDQFHRLEVEIVVEQQTSSGLKEHVALKHTINTAERIGTGLHINFQSTGWSEMATMTDDDGAISQESTRKNLLLHKEWIPVIRFGGNTFTDYTILENGSIENKAGKTEVAGAFKSAIGILSSSKNKPDPNSFLAAVRVRSTVTGPGLRPRTHIRTVMDITDKKKQDAAVDGTVVDVVRLERAYEMMGTMKVFPQVCWVPQTFNLSQSMSGMLQNHKPIMYGFKAAGANDLKAMEKVLKHVKPQSTHLLTLAHTREVMSPLRGDIAIRELNILSSFITPILKDGALGIQRGFDIIENKVYPLSGSRYTPRDARLLQGVVDTIAEEVVYGKKGKTLNTATSYGVDLQEGKSWSLVKNESDLVNLPTDIDPVSKSHLKGALKRGNWIVMSPSSERRTSWWRIDPETGSALGMGPEGRGSVMTEEIAILGMVLTIGGLINCVPQGGSSSNNSGCCFAVALAGEVGVMILAFMLGGPPGAVIGFAVALAYAAATMNSC